VQVSAGGVRDPGNNVVWYPRCRRRPVLAGRVAGRCEELVRMKASGRGWPVAGIMPGHVHLFVKAHRRGPPSRVARRFKGLTSPRLVRPMRP